MEEPRLARDGHSLTPVRRKRHQAPPPSRAATPRPAASGATGRPLSSGASGGGSDNTTAVEVGVGRALTAEGDAERGALPGDADARCRTGVGRPGDGAPDAFAVVEPPLLAPPCFTVALALVCGDGGGVGDADAGGL